MKMIFLPTSSNKKTGDIMQSYSSRSTCPKSCVFKNNGCYAEGVASMHGSVMNAILSMWNNHIKELEKNA